MHFLGQNYLLPSKYVFYCICFQFDDFTRTPLHHQSMYIQDELNLIYLPGLAHTLRLEAFLESAPWKYYLHQSVY